MAKRIGECACALVAAGACVIALHSLAGCNIVGPVYAIASGPPKVAAAYALDKERATVIFVDDRASVLPRRSLRQTVAQSAEKKLLDEDVLKTVIESRAIAAVAARDPADKPTDIATLGRTVSAQVVIYVSLDRFGLSQDGQVLQPYADARVKVIDTDREGARVWPEEREGHPVRVLLPQSRKELPRTASAIAQAQDALAAELGVAIAQLFYKHVPEAGPSRSR